MISAVFAKDSTGMLVKKYMVYKLMSSNLFINYSLGLMNIFYKILGVNLTNLCINKSVGSLFTSGESISTLVADIKALEKSNIYGIGNYVVEGLATMDDEFIQGVMNLRGRVVPLMDSWTRLGLGTPTYTNRTIVIVVEADGALTGLVADGVSGVSVFPPETVEPYGYGQAGRLRAVLGIALARPSSPCLRRSP